MLAGACPQGSSRQTRRIGFEVQIVLLASLFPMSLSLFPMSPIPSWSLSLLSWSLSPPSLVLFFHDPCPPLPYPHPLPSPLPPTL